MVERDSFDANSLPRPRNRKGGGRNAARVNGNGHRTDLVTSLRVLGDLTQRIGLAGMAGITFNGKRDLYNALGFKRDLIPKDYSDRYRRGGITARIIEAFPDATWAGGAEIVEDENPDVLTALEEDFTMLAERLQLWSIMHRADVLAGLGYFSVLLIGAAGDPKMENELPRMSSQEDVLYISPYGPEEVTINRFEENTENERFGLPLEYTVQRRTTNVQTTQNFSRRVHWSRIIHVADGLLEDRVNGTPRLERVWNDLDNLDKVTGGGSEAFWRRAHQGYHWNLDKDLKVDPDTIDKMKQEAEEFEHGLRRTMATRGMELTALGSDVANFDNPVRAIISLISGATKIPQRILLGSERGELASTQDRENWNERVQARRDNFATPLVRGLVDRLIEYGALPAPAIASPEVGAPPLEVEFDDEQELEAPKDETTKGKTLPFKRAAAPFKKKDEEDEEDPEAQKTKPDSGTPAGEPDGTQEGERDPNEAPGEQADEDAQEDETRDPGVMPKEKGIVPKKQGSAVHDYDVRWPEIKALTMVEQSTVATAWAGLVPAGVVTPDEIRDRVLGLDPLTEEQKAELEAAKPQPPQMDPKTGKPLPPGMALDKDGKVVKQDELDPADAMDPNKSNAPGGAKIDPKTGKPIPPGMKLDEDGELVEIDDEDEDEGRFAGEGAGHEFHGNQWTEGDGGSGGVVKGTLPTRAGIKSMYSVEDGSLISVVKRGSGYYGAADKFDFSRPTEQAMIAMLEKLGATFSGSERDK